MLTNWRMKRERKRLQAQCPHDWHVLRTFQVDVSDRYATRFDWRDFHDVYCPICESTRFGVSDEEMIRIEQKRRIRRLYERGEMEFRKGDVITWNE